jgi:hypothetical protein
LLELCVVTGHIKKSREWKNKEYLLNSIHDNENLDWIHQLQWQSDV